MVRIPHLRLRVVAVALAVAAGFVVLATFGTALPASPFKAIELDGPTIADAGERHVAIVDSESRRLLILNKNRKLTGIVDCDAPNAPVEAIVDVCVSGDTIYVAGIRYNGDSETIASQRIVAYDARGASEQIVYDLEAKQDEVLPSIKTMDNDCEADENVEGVYAVLCSDQYGEQLTTRLELIYADRKGSESLKEVSDEVPHIFDVGFSAKQELYATLSERGVLADTETEESDNELSKSCAFTTLDISDSGTVYAYDDVSKSVYGLLDEGDPASISQSEEYASIHVNGDMLAACNRDHNTVLLADLATSSKAVLSEVVCSRILKAWISVVQVSRAYAAVFIVAVLLIKLRRRLKKKDYEGFGAFLASVAVVFVVSLAIAYTSYGTYDTMQKTRANEINTFADYLALTASSMSESIQKCTSRIVFRESSQSYESTVESLGEATWPLMGLAHSATDNSIGTYVSVYGKDDQGLYYLYDSSSEHVLGTGGVSSTIAAEIEKVFSENKVDDNIRTGRTLYDATQYRLVRIPSTDGEGTVGVIEIGGRMRTFGAAIARDQIQRTITLLVMVLVVYLTYVELRSCAHCFVEFQKMRHHHDAIAILTRPFSFFVTLLSSIDAVMTTLIARQMLTASGNEASGILLALPSVMLGVGLVLGQATYALVGSRVLIRTLMKRGAVLMALAAVFTGTVVLSGNFWLYCAAKLTMAVPFGLLYTLSYSLPRRADTDEIRELAASGIKRTDTSAAALGTVLGGMVAQSLGNAWVYVLVAVVSVIVYAMASVLLPRTRHPLEKESKRTATEQEALGVLLTRKTTLPIILFIMVPAILSAGYNSIIFPLYSANLGLQTSTINNLFVLGQLVVFVSISVIEYLEGRFDKWRVSGIAVALLGAVFLLFSLNTSLVWAVVTIALVGVLCKSSDGWKALWVRSAKANGLATGLATGEMFAVRSVLLVVQPLLLGSLLTVGNRAIVIILGILCALCAVAFYFTTRNTPLAPERNEAVPASEPQESS